MLVGAGAGHGGWRGLGAGTGPSPVTSCWAAGARAALQRLRRQRPRQIRLGLPLTPGPAAPAFFEATPPLPSRRPFPLALPPSLLRRRPGPPAGGRAPGSSQVRRPDRAWRGPRGRRGRGAVGGGWGLGLGGPARPASFPGPHPRPWGLPRGGGSSCAPSVGAPHGLDPSPSTPRNRCHAAFPHSSSRAGMPKLFPGRGRRVPASSP